MTKNEKQTKWGLFQSKVPMKYIRAKKGASF